VSAILRHMGVTRQLRPRRVIGNPRVSARGSNDASRGATVSCRDAQSHALGPLRYADRDFLQNRLVGGCSHDPQLSCTWCRHTGRLRSGRSGGVLVVAPGCCSDAERDTSDDEDRGEDDPVAGEARTPYNMPTHASNPVPRDKLEATVLADCLGTSRSRGRNTQLLNDPCIGQPSSLGTAQRHAILAFGYVPVSQGEKQSLRTDARRPHR
jgi:hypothetical protein